MEINTSLGVVFVESILCKPFISQSTKTIKKGKMKCQTQLVKIICDWCVLANRKRYNVVQLKLIENGSRNY